MRSAQAAGAVALVLALAFAFTGLEPSWRRGALVHDPELAVAAESRDPTTLRVFALNLAKAGFHRGGFDFAAPSALEERLERVAAAIRAADPDLVFLSEVVHACGPRPQDQAEFLAGACGFPWRATSDNYRFGVPGYAIRSGNALLSELPLNDVRVEALPGEGSFLDPTNVRRVLFAEAPIGGRPVLLASVRNDSFDLVDNARQAELLVGLVGDRTALLGGDFNAEADDEAFERYAAAGWSWGDDARPTHPAPDPRRRIDFVIDTERWTRLEERVIDTGASDHLAVLTVFRIAD